MTLITYVVAISQQDALTQMDEDASVPYYVGTSRDVAFSSLKSITKIDDIGRFGVYVVTTFVEKVG